MELSGAESLFPGAGPAVYPVDGRLRDRVPKMKTY